MKFSQWAALYVSVFLATVGLLMGACKFIDRDPSGLLDIAAAVFFACVSLAIWEQRESY